MKNNNEKHIEDLKKLINYFELHPELPTMGYSHFPFYVRNKAELLQTARFMGMFKKVMTEWNYTLIAKVDDITIGISVPRSEICEKVVTWKCPEEGLLEQFEKLGGSNESK